jgi:hypothetical protein
VDNPAPTGQHGSVRSQRREQDIESVEWATLQRQFDGVIQQARIEELGRQIADSGGVGVAKFYGGFCGDRPTLTLDDGRTVRLWLYEPTRGIVAILRSFEWRREAWRLGVSFGDGSAGRLVAWRAELLL